MSVTVPLPKGAVIDAEGVWCQVLAEAPDGKPRPALFLDRDGVVIEETGFLARPEEAILVPGAAAVIAEANRCGVGIVLITNQSGIGRGYYGWDAFIAVQQKVLADLAAAGACVDGVFACPHHPEALSPYRHPNHPARKPNPGMLQRAERLLRLDLALSWIVGDRAVDMEAGRNAGLAGGILVATGFGRDPVQQATSRALAARGYSVQLAESIADVPALVPLLR
jgi:D-glycero-D-manno-heptose 1,7-bisphosphate phosphatase